MGDNAKHPRQTKSPDSATLKAAGIVLDDIPISLKLSQARFHWALRSMLEPANLGYYIDAEGIVVTTREKVAELSKRP